MFRKLVILIMVLGFAGSAWALIIGEPTSANGWDTTSAVTASDSTSGHSRVTPADTIVGVGPSAEDYSHNLGMDPNGLPLHSVRWETMWSREVGSMTDEATKYHANVNYAGPVWIAYEFDAVYKLTAINIWNYNEYSGIDYWQNTDIGIKNCYIEYSADGTTWNTVASPTTLLEAPGDGWNGWDTNSYDPCEYALDAGNIVSLGGVQAKYVVITPEKGANGNYNGTEAKYGISEIQFVADANYAWGPNPYDSETDVLTSRLPITWGAGTGTDIAYHNVYFSTDQSAVNGRTAPNTVYPVATTSHNPTVEAGRTYYWAVDELNSSYSVVTGGTGSVWNFEIPYCVPGTEPTDVEGNVNGDCFINFVDFSIVAENWLKTGMWP